MRTARRQAGQRVVGPLCLPDTLFTAHRSFLLVALVVRVGERFMSYEVAALVHRYVWVLQQGDHPGCLHPRVSCICVWVLRVERVFFSFVFAAGGGVTRIRFSIHYSNSFLHFTAARYPSFFVSARVVIARVVIAIECVGEMLLWFRVD